MDVTGCGHEGVFSALLIVRTARRIFRDNLKLHSVF
jgi:hypothetical protein